MRGALPLVCAAGRRVGAGAVAATLVALCESGVFAALCVAAAPAKGMPIMFGGGFAALAAVSFQN